MDALLAKNKKDRMGICLSYLNVTETVNQRQRLNI